MSCGSYAPESSPRTKAGAPWTTHDDAQLAAWWAAGHKVGPIARAFDRSTGAINARLKLLGLKVTVEPSPGCVVVLLLRVEGAQAGACHSQLAGGMLNRNAV